MRLNREAGSRPALSRNCMVEFYCNVPLDKF